MYEGNLISELITKAESVSFYQQIGTQVDAFWQFSIALPCWHPAKPTIKATLEFCTGEPYAISTSQSSKP
jgi:hypothetical protein